MKPMPELDNFEEVPDVLLPHYEFPDSEYWKLEIKDSRLPASGKGLFATQQFAPGECIAEYYGSVISSQNNMDPFFNWQDKMVEVDHKHSIIGRGPASRANDIVIFDYTMSSSKGKELVNYPGVSRNACIWLPGRGKAFLQANTRIKQGEQVYINYGPEYWDFFLKQGPRPV